MPEFISVVNMIPNPSSGETNQDSEPNLAVNPVNTKEMAATAFTPSPNVGSKNSPIYYSNDGGNTWALLDIIAGTPVRDQTLRFSSASGTLYAGVLWGTGSNIALINYDILRTNDFSGASTMTRLARRQNDDQPFVQAATVPSGPDTGKDRIYVGSNDHAPSNVPATVDYSLDAGAVLPVTSTTLVIEGRSVSRDYPQTRPAIHTNGTVYAVFYAIIGGSADVVIVRDDNWATGATPFKALIDSGDSKQGVRIVTGLSLPPLNTIYLGQQRVDGDLSIAVDPNNSATVYVCYGDQQAGTYTLHVVKSTDSGVNWSADLRTITNAVNPALAIDEKGKLGFLYQQVTGSGGSQRWRTTFELTRNDFGTITTHYLADVPASTPARNGDPYLGDYLYMMTEGTTFYGIFSAANTPDMANFPSGVAYQRNANFTTKTLLNLDNVTPVAASIDPYFFKVLTEFGTLVTAIASGGNFAATCVGSFADELLTLNNSGNATLTISNIISSSPEFLTPDVIAYPMEVGPGDSTEVVIRFAPTTFGPKNAIITVISDDPKGPHTIAVSGMAPAPRLSLVLADQGSFHATCIGCFTDEPLILNNSGKCTLTVTSITSSSGDFLVAEVLAFPLTIGQGDSLPIPIRFAPTSFGAKSATITVSSNDPAGLHTIGVSGVAPAPALSLVIADHGAFSATCVGSFADEPLILNNSGKCTLTVTSITSTSAEFLVPEVLSFPLTIGPGDALPIPIRFAPTSFGAKSATITVNSNDPAGSHTVAVSGVAPSGKLTVTGSTCFGGVKACCPEERIIAICNTGDCKLHVTSVAFKRKTKHWKLVNNPFPATLHPGSCLNLVIRYKADEKCPRCCELVITSDDPTTPVKVLELLAFTIWGSCGCKNCCEDCRKGTCQERHDEKCCCPPDCCDDDDGEEHQD
jgi:Abnormal spindle-like microcephaly-assoc'd, ASPM-SPD-2-Hydin